MVKPTCWPTRTPLRRGTLFFEELYGPREYSERDAQSARVLSALVRLFPQEVVRTVVALSELHALSESLDMAMGLRWSASMWIEVCIRGPQVMAGYWNRPDDTSR